MATTSASPIDAFSASVCQSASSDRRLRVWQLEVAQIGHVVDQQPLTIDTPEPRGRVALAEAVVEHHRADLVGDADTGGAGAIDHDPLLARPRAGDAHARQDRRQRDRARALHVVVEDPAAVAVVLEDPAGVGWPEVLEVQQRVRKQGRCCLHVCLDQRVVALAPNAAVAVADVHRVFEQRLAIGADVEHHRDHATGMDARGGRVDRELADRDRHPVGSPVTDPEDRLGVGRDEQVDVLGAEAVVAKRVLDAFDVVDRQVDAVGALKLVAVALDRLRDHRRVNDREHLLEMHLEQLVVEDLVAIVQRCQKAVAGDVARLRLVLLVGAVALLLERQHRRRQQSLQPKHRALLERERGAAVVARVAQQCPSSRHWGGEPSLPPRGHQPRLASTGGNVTGSETESSSVCSMPTSGTSGSRSWSSARQRW